ncbi:Fe(3+)-hydroxamate ABC transporter permease FhuB [Consotaella aegiceratis]|uniref:Fe(3+)-hydroxamate ABC transporter permease FhuB n=1 Tax=Consotaella aegiceratis TaxID=3097961 RepID=UPI002F3F5841
MRLPWSKPATVGWILAAGLAALLFVRQAWLAWPLPADAMQRAILVHSVLPRAAVAIVAGAALALSGALLQRVLRNPIADPSTLGVAAGAQLAMTAATIYAPGLMAVSREPIAFAGGAAALAVILALSWRRGLDPVTVIISGMLISLVAASLSATLVLAHGEYMMSLFIWGGGSLTQQSWGPSLSLVLRLAIAGIATAALARPLLLLTLDDTSAKALGLGVDTTRLLTLAVAVGLATSVTASVGVIGFVGLAAPNLARLAGARTLKQILCTAPLVGAALLWLTDSLVQLVRVGGTELVPTGAVTALLGGPLLLWLLPRLRRTPARSSGMDRTASIRHPRRMLLALLAITALLAVLALFLGKGPEGWLWATGSTFDVVAPWRWPRILAAGAAGAMLAAAGFVMQRVTGNPMASPEVLGISSGAGVGLATVLILAGSVSRDLEFIGCLAGSLAALAAVLVIAVRHQFGAERLLLSGLAVGALAGAVITAVIARGGPESMRLLTWLSGSTQRVAPTEAIILAVFAVAMIAPLPFLRRWLTILPLGNALARSIGLSPRLAGGGLVLLAAVLSATATLFVGPLSFVGLMAPHLARLAGGPRPGPQLALSVAIGTALMVLADWLARTLTFPYQLPLGLFASLIGAPYLIWLINRRPQGATR